ncbi:MAG: transporter permease [Clostridiales bacterium]|jgi:peptide/nickel transport system permease protein|nr:transporter permease [Clostridiales bacterium]
MKQFIIRRLILSVFILVGVSMALYALIRAMPSNYVKQMTSGKPGVTDQLIEQLEKNYGLDSSIPEGYVKWAGNVIKGDFGTSFVYKQPVFKVINDKMWASFWLSFIALILELLIAIPLGIISATKQYSKTDYAITTFAFLGISLPSFFFAALLQKFFAMDLRIFPLQGMVTAREDYEGFRLLLDIGWHYCLPIIVFVVLGVGSLMRYTRTNMLEVLNSDFIRTARAKGLSEHKVIYKHAFRNTLIPIVTMVGGSLPGLFSGAIITEGIFAIDGLGYTALQALKFGDIPFLMGFNMFLAVLTLIGTLISDVLYAVVDPRVRLS